MNQRSHYMIGRHDLSKRIQSRVYNSKYLERPDWILKAVETVTEKIIFIVRRSSTLFNIFTYVTS